MEAITERTRIREAAAKWRTAYPEFGTFDCGAATTTEIQARLDALDPETATPADVDAATGGRYPTQFPCDECGRVVGRVVLVGKVTDRDGDDLTPAVCRDCLVKALALLDAAP